LFFLYDFWYSYVFLQVVRCSVLYIKMY
jgi:hypothetical protein